MWKKSRCDLVVEEAAPLRSWGSWPAGWIDSDPPWPGCSGFTILQVVPGLRRLLPPPRALHQVPDF